MRHHIFIDVKGILTNWTTREMGKLGFTDDNGRKMSGAEVKIGLLDELSKGHNYLPMGNCDNFDRKEKGCLGHESPGQSAQGKP